MTARTPKINARLEYVKRGPERRSNKELADLGLDSIEKMTARVIAGLTPKERKILNERFGIKEEDK